MKHLTFNGARDQICDFFFLLDITRCSNMNSCIDNCCLININSYSNDIIIRKRLQSVTISTVWIYELMYNTVNMNEKCLNLVICLFIYEIIYFKVFFFNFSRIVVRFIIIFLYISHFRIGLCGFENPMRSPKTDELKRQIGQVI